MNVVNNITEEETLEFLEDLQENLKNIAKTVTLLIDSFTTLSEGILPQNDFERGLIRTKGFDNFYQNILYCDTKQKKREESILYLLKYIFEDEKTQNFFSDYIKDSFGIITPITKKTIKKPTLSKEEKQQLDKKEQINLYAKRIKKLFDCYGEIIIYRAYFTEKDKQNRRIIIDVSIKAINEIYKTLCDDIIRRGYSINSLEQINYIIRTYQTGKKEIKIEDIEKFKEDLAKNIYIINDGVLAGDLVQSFINLYNNKLYYNQAKKVLDILICELKKDGLENSCRRLNKASDIMTRKINKSENEIFCRILEMLIDKEADLSSKGESRCYYEAINGLSIDCSCLLRKKNIYYDEDFIESKIKNMF